MASITSTNVPYIQSKWKDYLEFSKSGIVVLVLITFSFGYLAGQSFEAPFLFGKFLWSIIGMALLVSGSTALNQYQEIETDRLMPRTANRPLVTGRISPKEGLFFIIISVSAGLAILFFEAGISVFVQGLIALFTYNFCYTLLWKRHNAFAAIPGAIPGALPVLMGFSAVTNQFLPSGGFYLFLILFFWQMPHFWVLALKYSADYKNANIPTLPVKLGTKVTMKHITVWCLAYAGIGLLAPFFLPVGWIYQTGAIIISIGLMYRLVKFRSVPLDKAWLSFFLGVNFSLVGYLGLVVADLWSVYLLVPLLTR